MRGQRTFYPRGKQKTGALIRAGLRNPSLYSDMPPSCCLFHILPKQRCHTHHRRNDSLGVTGQKRELLRSAADNSPYPTVKRASIFSGNLTAYLL